MVVGAVVYYTLRLRGSGKIRTVNVKVYSDPAATIEVSAVDWGEISPGGQSRIQLYVKNTGNVVANLTLTAENWAPSSAANYMTLSWDYNGQALQLNEVRPVLFTLSVASNITGITDFSVDLVITAAG